MMIRNEALLEWMKPRYTLEEVIRIRELLEKQGTFQYSTFKNGLFPAAGFDPKKFASTGYQNVWVRDNFYVAYAHYVMGETSIAVKNARALASFFQKQRPRFEGMIRGTVDANESMNRPHIRFNGKRISELKQHWSHAQNDALGYFIWFYSKLILEGHILPTVEELELLACFVMYFQAIHYWRDADNGHWEEKSKVEASSIGVVVGALQMLQCALAALPHTLKFEGRKIHGAWIDELIARGRHALGRILPSESIRKESARRYDAALLFLIYPMDVVSEKMGDQIIGDVTGHLLGDYGIRRYLGDSYWAAEYRKSMNQPMVQSEDTSLRDGVFQGAAEAQWCIFDPILSIIHGRRYQKTRRPKDLARQVAHLNRSLGQVTGSDDAAGPFRCPELYCLESGRYVPNDHTPLLWTQANLRVALRVMEENVFPGCLEVIHNIFDKSVCGSRL